MTEDYFSHLLPSIGGALADFYDSLTPWLLFGLALIIADLRFGIEKAAKRGEEIRGSTAWRRTINNGRLLLLGNISRTLRAFRWRRLRYSRRFDGPTFNNLRH